MGLTAIFFYLFATLALASGAMVIVARNPVHAVLFLILTFFNAAGLFILLGAEFLAMLLIIVYVGAVAVLFLFVVMMLDVDFAELRAGFIKNAPVGLIVGGVVLAELLALFWARAIAPPTNAVAGTPIPQGASNTEALGQILYTKYVYFFQGAGLVLLVAMIGAIVLTLRHKTGVKRQSIADQVARGPATAVRMVKVTSGGSVIPDAPKR
ncbi:NADH-quinone oxidoreductase subunit J [Hyphomicrobium sp.]|uniref:NADH-quinone oxidoreductase subunit J n=1 Tax=Hyphomicrobium sp. TaxID=82 RepID=UPI003F7183AE